jgi:4-amino-4-deoxy-L-arabinose transferase-like glycosyltransferase
MQNGQHRLGLRGQPGHWLLVLAVLGLGIFVRVWHFPHVPPGLNQDEAASAYEAYSLAETGCDKWGNQWPAYFPAWGSGQNVLLAYLTVPIIKVFGLSIFSARLGALLVGLLTLPLFYYSLRPMGRYPALLGLLLLAVAPWHFMLSRWGLESNLVPFWMLLGCTMVARAISTQQRRWIMPSLVPFAVALYAYGITLVVLPTLFGLVLVGYFGRIRQQASSWLVAMGLFALVAAPFGLFIIENYLLGHSLAWTDSLFFSTPLLPATRLGQDGQGGLRALYEVNTAFIGRGFDDGEVYNQLAGYPLLLRFTWALATLGFASMLYRLQHARRFLAECPAAVVGFLFLAWGIACGPLLFLLRLNVNRSNHFFLPCLALAAWATNEIVKGLKTAAPKRFIQQAVLVWYILEGSLAVRYYLLHYPQGQIKSQFNSGLPDAFAAIGKLHGISQVRITSQLPLNYVYTLYYLHYPPARFQQEAQVEVINGVYQVNKFNRYVFNDQYLQPGKPYAYLARRGEVSGDKSYYKTVSYSDDFWEVGVMHVATSTVPSANKIEE